MARKKTLTVDFQTYRRGWSLKLSGFDTNACTELVGAVRAIAKKHDLFIVNAHDPFGREEEPPRRKKKTKGTSPEVEEDKS